jgi:uncharacterized protein YdeI (YjbR/CyaY-like superfamily)
MKPSFFKSTSDFRKWMEKFHHKEKELIVGFYKKYSGKQSITWPESVDVALCFGWIDGIRKSLDEISYTIRFTPRNPKSTWSAINIKKVKTLTKLGLMQQAGIDAFKKLDKKNSKIYSFERRSVTLSKNYENIFKSNKKAWEYFSLQTPYYKKITVHWVMSAKQDETQLRRLMTLINDSANLEKIAPLRRKN